jgi:hypothetical protein
MNILMYLAGMTLDRLMIGPKPRENRAVPDAR